MARLDILEYPDPRLRLKSEPVTRFDKDLKRHVDDLLETLYDGNAIGLSSPQVGTPRRILVTDLSGNASEPQVYMNPEIVSKAAWGLVEESCMSIPGIVGTVIRATAVRVRAQDSQGRTFEHDLTGMKAVCLQHEVDHLNGKLFIDRLSIFRRLAILARVRAKLRQQNKAA
ncbi:MAG: peptide deformylase [Pseudomonadota bacterium]